MLPLRALTIFETALRHGSFKLAAEELHLTPGAVGQQIQKLETWLGVKLFLRKARQVAATPQGLELYRQIAPALSQITQASHKLRHQQSQEVRLSLSPALASKWLGARMGDFMARYPEIDVHISASTQVVNFDTQPFDLAIRHFDGSDSSLESQLLYRDEIRLLCSPAYRQSLNLQTPDDLIRATLLHNTLHACWADWLNRYTEITEQAQRAIRGIHYDQTLLAIDAAKRGQGVVLTPRILADEELNSGELIEPFPCRLQYPEGFYLVHPLKRPLNPAGEKFKQWLIEQFSREHTDRG